MAEIHIQPKKSAPSPWLLVLLVAALLAGAAYLYLRPDPADSSAAATAPAALAAYAATDAAAPNYARRGLRQLAATLVDLADRADLQDPAIQEQRNNLTSATARLSDDPKASLRPGFVAAAGLLRTIQQKAYPEQDAAATQLQQLAGQLSGRTATAADQQQVRHFLSGAATLLEPLSQPAAAQ